MERWMNKVAVVTGASSGIGEACTRALLEKGMIVVGLARRQTYMANELRASLPKDQRKRFHAIKCDLRLERDIRNAFAWIDEHLGGLHVFVNNVGIIRHNVQIVGENNNADLRANIDVNVIGMALCTRIAFQSMKRRNFDGHMILINTEVPNIMAINLNIYKATQFAITAMIEVLRHEFLQHQTKIKVTSINPGVCNRKTIRNCSTKPMKYSVLQCKDIAIAVLFCIQAPPNVRIGELIIEPLDSQC